MAEDMRQSIIDACLWMQDVGLTQGTSGNVSLRAGDGFLVTPSAVPYDQMRPEMICEVPLDAPPAAGSGPSTEWPFHQAIYKSREDVCAVVHAHPVHATAVSVQRRPIPAVHYMVAAFGGADVPVTDYALFGSDALAAMVARALTHRHGCLMANHGATTVADTLERALWRMRELETLARVFLLSEHGGQPVLLSQAEIEDALAAFDGYGVRPETD